MIARLSGDPRELNLPDVQAAYQADQFSEQQAKAAFDRRGATFETEQTRPPAEPPSTPPQMDDGGDSDTGGGGDIDQAPPEKPKGGSPDQPPRDEIAPEPPTPPGPRPPDEQPEGGPPTDSEPPAPPEKPEDGGEQIGPGEIPAEIPTPPEQQPEPPGRGGEMPQQPPEKPEDGGEQIGPGEIPVETPTPPERQPRPPGRGGEMPQEPPPKPEDGGEQIGPGEIPAEIPTPPRVPGQGGDRGARGGGSSETDDGLQPEDVFNPDAVDLSGFEPEGGTREERINDLLAYASGEYSQAFAAGNIPASQLVYEDGAVDLAPVASDRIQAAILSEQLGVAVSPSEVTDEGQASDAALERAYEQRVAEQTGLALAQIEGDVTDGDFELSPTTERLIGSQRLSESIEGFTYGPSEVVVTDEGYRLTDQAELETVEQRTEQSFLDQLGDVLGEGSVRGTIDTGDLKRNRAGELRLDVATRLALGKQYFEETTGTDLRLSDITLETEGGGWGLRRQGRRKVVADRFEDRIGRNVDYVDVFKNPTTGQWELTGSSEKRLAAATMPGITAADLRNVETGIALRPDVRRERKRQQFDEIAADLSEETGFDFDASDLQLEDDGSVGVTPSADLDFRQATGQAGQGAEPNPHNVFKPPGYDDSFGSRRVGADEVTVTQITPLEKWRNAIAKAGIDIPESRAGDGSEEVVEFRLQYTGDEPLAAGSRIPLQVGGPGVENRMQTDLPRLQPGETVDVRVFPDVSADQDSVTIRAFDRQATIPISVGGPGPEQGFDPPVIGSQGNPSEIGGGQTPGGMGGPGTSFKDTVEIDRVTDVPELREQTGDRFDAIRQSQLDGIGFRDSAVIQPGDQITEAITDTENTGTVFRESDIIQPGNQTGFESTGRTVPTLDDPRRVGQFIPEDQEAQLRQDAATSIDAATPGVDVDADDVALAPEAGVVTEDGEVAGVEASLGMDSDARQTLELQQARQRIGAAIDPVQAQIERAKAQSRQRLIETASRETGVNITDADIDMQGTKAVLDEEGQERVLEAQVNRQLADRGVEADFDIGQDIQIGDEGDVSLSADARQQAITEQVLDRGSVSVTEQSADVPFTDQQLGGEERQIDVESSEQLRFNEQGQLVDVQPQDETLPIPVLGPGLSRLANRWSAAGEAVYDTVLQPTGTALGQAASAPLVLSSGIVGDEESAERAIERGEKLGQGATGIIRAGFEAPQFAETAGILGIEAGQYVADEGIVEGAAAAGATGVAAAEDIAVASINNPYRTAGQLVGSSAIMGAAAAVGPQTGLASRLAIQPGEEIIGYGGNFLTRQVSPGAASRLFPNNEPLIFSEEAAIRTAKAGGRRIRNLGGRATSAVDDVPVRTPDLDRLPDVEVEQRPGGPTIDVSPVLQRQVIDAGRGVGESIGSRFRRAADTDLGDVSQRISDPIESAASRAGEIPEQVSGAARGAELSLEAETRDLLRGARERGESAAESVSDIPERVSEAVDPGEIGRVRGALAGAELSARAGIGSLRRGVRQRQQAIGDRFGDAASRASDIPADVRGAMLGAELSLEAETRSALRGARDRGESAAETVTEIPGRIGQRFRSGDAEMGRVRGALLGGEVSAQAAVEDVRQRAQNRGEALGELLADQPEATGQWLRDVADPGEIGRLRGAVAGAGLSARAGVGSLRRGVRQRGEAASDFVSGIPDTTIRIGPFLPRAQEVRLPSSSVEVEQESEVDVDQPEDIFTPRSDVEAEMTTGIPEFGRTEQETETETGVAVERVIERETETEQETDTSRRWFEATVDETGGVGDIGAGDLGLPTVSDSQTGTATSIEDGLQAVTQPEIQPDDEPLSSIGGETSRPGDQPTQADPRMPELAYNPVQQPLESSTDLFGERVGRDARVELIPELERETEPEIGVEIETETETEFDRRFELEQEQEQEQELELEFRFERETELESERDGDELGQQAFGGMPIFGGAREEVLTDFANPLTGGVLETEGENPSRQLDEPVFLGEIEF